MALIMYRHVPQRRHSRCVACMVATDQLRAHMQLALLVRYEPTYLRRQ